MAIKYLVLIKLVYYNFSKRKYFEGTFWYAHKGTSQYGLWRSWLHRDAPWGPTPRFPVQSRSTVALESLPPFLFSLLLREFRPSHPTISYLDQLLLPSWSICLMFCPLQSILQTFHVFPLPPCLPLSHLLHIPYVPTNTTCDAVAGVCLEHLTGCPVHSNHPLKISSMVPWWYLPWSTQAVNHTLLRTAAVANLYLSYCTSLSCNYFCICLSYYG